MLRYETALGVLAVWLYSLLAVTDLKSPVQIGSTDGSLTHFTALLKPGINLKEMKAGNAKGERYCCCLLLLLLLRTQMEM